MQNLFLLKKKTQTRKKKEPCPKAGVRLHRPRICPEQKGFAPAEDLARHTQHILHRLSDAVDMLWFGKSTNLSLPGGAKKADFFHRGFFAWVFSYKAKQWQVYSERFLGL